MHISFIGLAPGDDGFPIESSHLASHGIVLSAVAPSKPSCKHREGGIITYSVDRSRESGIVELIESKLRGGRVNVRIYRGVAPCRVRFLAQ